LGRELPLRPGELLNPQNLRNGLVLTALLSAKTQIEAGENRRAEFILLRAKADTELALALAREADAMSDAEEAVEDSNDSQRTTDGARCGSSLGLLASLGLARERLPLPGGRRSREVRLGEAGSRPGMVITLSGGVLFASAKWQLLPAAQTKLNEVADALTKQDKDSAIVVEGHTDSQGKDAANQVLLAGEMGSFASFFTAQPVLDLDQLLAREEDLPTALPTLRGDAPALHQRNDRTSRRAPSSPTKTSASSRSWSAGRGASARTTCSSMPCRSFTCMASRSRW
jgi:outer membrane protein OmpA-like peptidoglycan-associated protein